MIDLRQLRYFVHIAEIGNLNKAAQVLNIAQSALSRQMSKLESDLGNRLFLRHGRGVSLTEAGRTLQAEANKLLAHAHEVEMTMKGHGANAEEVTIGLPAIFSNALCRPLTRAIHEQMPDLKIKFLESYSGTLLQLLRTHAIDIAVLYGLRTDKGLDSTFIMSKNLYAIGKKGVLPDRGFVQAADLNGCHLIMPHRPHVIWDLIEEIDANPGKITEAATLSATQDLMEHEQGIFVHQKLASKNIAGDDLVSLPFKEPSMHLKIYISSLKSSSINKGVGIAKDAAVSVIKLTLR